MTAFFQACLAILLLSLLLIKGERPVGQHHLSKVWDLGESKRDD